MLSDIAISSVIRNVRRLSIRGLRMVLPIFQRAPIGNTDCITIFREGDNKIWFWKFGITIYITLFISSLSLSSKSKKIVIRNVIPLILSDKSVIRNVTRPYPCRITNRITILNKANLFEVA